MSSNVADLPSNKTHMRLARKMIIIVASAAVALSGVAIAYARAPQAIAGTCIESGPPGLTLSADRADLLVGDTATISVVVSNVTCYSVVGSPVTFSVSSDTATLSATEATVDEYGWVSVTLTDTVDETVSISATISLNGDPAQPVIGPDNDGQSVDVTFEPVPVPGPPPVNQCVGSQPVTGLIASAPGAVVGNPVTVTATFTDENCAPMEGYDVKYVSDSKTATLSAVESTTGPDGTVDIIVNDVVAEDVMVTVTIMVDGQPQDMPDGPIQVTFSPGAPSVGPFLCGSDQHGTGLYVDSSAVTVDQSVAVKALVTDVYCNPLLGVPVNLGLVTGDNASLPTTSGTTDENGKVLVSLADTRPEAVTVTGTMTIDTDVVPIGSVDVGFSAGAAVAGPYTCQDGSPGTGMYADHASVSVDDAATITVVVTDQFCNWLPATANLKVNGSADVALIAPAKASAQTPAGVAIVTDTKAESVSVSGTASSGSGGVTLGTVRLSFTPGQPSVGPFSCSSGQASTNIVADPAPAWSTESASVQVLVTDLYCNPLPGVAVFFSTDSTKAMITAADGNSGSMMTVKTDGAGQVTVSVSDPLAEVAHIGATIATGSNPGATVPGSGAVMNFLGIRPPDIPAITSPFTGTVTNNAKLPIAGTGHAGNTITVKEIGGAQVCRTTVATNGKWSCQPAQALSIGAHTLFAVASDSPTNVSAPSVPVDITVRLLTIDVDKAVVQAGDVQVVYGYNFNAGERVRLTLLSDMLDGGYSTANSDGTVAFLFAVPVDRASGSHSVTLTGDESGAVTMQFQVADASAPQDVVYASTNPAVTTGGSVATSPSFGVVGALICLIASIGLFLAIARKPQQSR